MSTPPLQMSSFANMQSPLNNKNLSEMNISSVDDIQNDISAIPIPPNSTSTSLPSLPSSISPPSPPSSPISPISPASPVPPISPSSTSSKDKPSIYRQKNFFDAGGNVEFNKDMYLKTLNNLRNNQYIGYINPIERQEREKKRLSNKSNTRYSNNTNIDTNTNTSINDNSIAITDNKLSKSPEMVPLKSIDSQPSKSFATQTSRSFDVQGKSNLKRPYKSFDSQPSNSYVKYPSKSFNNPQTIDSYTTPISTTQTQNSTGYDENMDDEDPPMNISLEGIEENEDNLEANPVSDSGMIISKDELNKKLEVNSLSKIEEPDISLSSMDNTNFSLHSGMPNIYGNDMDISLSSVEQNEGEVTTEVGNIVESSFNFGVKNKKRTSQESQSSGGLISSPSFSSPLVSSPKLISVPGPSRTAFGLKRTSPLYLNQIPTVNRPSSNHITNKLYLQTNTLINSNKQNYTNVTSPKKSTISSDKEENSSNSNSNNNNIKINLNNYNEEEINKVKIDKNNVDDILL